ncbi:FAD/NAD(P)-binding protein [Actinomadura madurae]|uniref:FAD/NAD(P)-binding protein n=1 Tax=Actinomadura madurae TaxID=1993 RepID=UPI0020D20738|nr:FAD/NAD(P)-binding protein [Actinomadura madurae]
MRVPSCPAPTSPSGPGELARGVLAWPAGFGRPSEGTAAEAARTHGGSYPTRIMVGDYLSWAFWRTVERGAPFVQVHDHRVRACGLRDLPDGRQRVLLSDAPRVLDADVVITAQGNADTHPGRIESELADRAAFHGLTYVPAASTADIGLDALQPAEPVLARGLGLAFIDLVTLLTSGRGGVFTRDDHGSLRYTPSGHEPVIFAGSRRGVPYRSKFRYEPADDLRALPRHFTGAVEGDRPLDFAADVWPLISRELAEAAYRELAIAHPERLSMEPCAFLARLDDIAAHDGQGFTELIERAVPRPADRIDVHGSDRPLQGRRFTDTAALQRWMIGYIAADVERGRDPGHSPHAAVARAIAAITPPLTELLENGRLSLEAADLHQIGAFIAFCRFCTSGPPGTRLEELLALARAGIVRFLGGAVDIELEDGMFEARSRSVSAVVQARALVEARLPGRARSRTTDPLQRCPHPKRYAVEPSDLSKPHANGLFFRQNDAVARSVLRGLGGTAR